MFVHLPLSVAPESIFCPQSSRGTARNRSAENLHMEMRASVARGSAIKPTAEAHKQCWSLLLYQ